MKALTFLGRHWKLIGIALVLSWGVRVDHLRVVYKGRWQAVAQEYALFKVAIVDRMAEAGKVQLADKRAKEAESERDAQKSDAAFADLSARYRAARLRLARSGGASDPARSGDLPGDEGARLSEDAAAGGKGAATVTISAAEYDAMADATAYAVAAHEWAAGLPQGED